MLNHTYKILSFLFLFILFSTSLRAQVSITGNPVDGRPLVAKTYEYIKGSPYLFNDWVKGLVKLSDGVVHEDMDLKYNLLEDHLVFKTEKNEPMLYAGLVKEFVLYYPNKLTPKLFRNGYPPVKSHDASSYYEVLVDAKTPLLKKTLKNIIQSRDYSTATQEKTFLESSSYFILQVGTLHPLKKDKNSALALLQDKSSELEKYIRENKLNLKNEEDLIKLVTYYNTL